MDFEFSKKYVATLVGAFVISIFTIGFSWQSTNQTYAEILSQEKVDANIFKKLELKLYEEKQKPEKREVKGLYLTAYSANSDKKLDQIIELINKTELNAVVFDTKDYSGKVLYDSDVELVNQLNLEEHRIKNIKDVVDKLHKHDIYVIARQQVFQDPALAEKKHEWAVKSKKGGIWRDYNGLAWLDPTHKEIWEYNVDLAKEAIRIGFDEINFDYVRFPSDGNMKLAKYSEANPNKVQVMEEFYSFLSKKLSDQPAYISLDFFGLVMERHDGMTIGQKIGSAVGKVDYISPMMYPSHYPQGHIGLTNPAQHPGKVIENGMKQGTPLFKNKRAEVRPWIQAFNIGAVYDDEKMRAQIDAVEKYTDAGWLLWNASNRYTTDGLKITDKK